MNRHTVTFSDGTVARRGSRTARYSWAWRIAYRRLGRNHAYVGFSSCETYAQGELEKRRQNIARIPADRHVSRVDVGQLARVQIDADQRAAMAQVIAPEVGFGKLGPDGDHQIGAGEDAGAVGPGKGGAEVQGIARRRDAAPGPGDEVGCMTARQNRAGGFMPAHRTAAEDEKRPAGLFDHADRLRHIGRTRTFGQVRRGARGVGSVAC